jgi:hypothetical protein
VIPVCQRCDGYIETDNRRWPGYCRPDCRELDAAERTTKRDQTQMTREIQ